MEQKKKPAQKPTRRSPPPSRSPVTTDHQQRYGSNVPQQRAPRPPKVTDYKHAPAKYAAQREDENMRAAIAASLADAEEEKRKRAKAKQAPLPVSRHHQRHQVPHSNAPAPNHAKSCGRKPAPAKAAAAQEEEDLRRAIAASLADRERQEARHRPHGRANEEARPEIRPPVPGGPIVKPRATEQQRFMAPPVSQRRPQAEHSSRHRVQEPRHRDPERSVYRTRKTSTRPAPVPPRPDLRWNPKDARTGEYLSDEAWDAQIL